MTVSLMRQFLTCLLLLLPLYPLAADRSWMVQSARDTQAVIEDILSELLEDGEVDAEALAADLSDMASQPVNINQATQQDFERLGFLTDQQIDELLLFIHQHPLDSLFELQLVHGLQDYQLRNLLPFFYVGEKEEDRRLTADVFRRARHEVLVRTDVRDIEGYEGDPVYVKGRYSLNADNRVLMGLRLVRPVGGGAQDLNYGGYVQLNKVGAFQTIVAGDFQASFGQGLVFAAPFHAGKSRYVLTAGNAQEGLRRYAGSTGEGLHGVGATAGWEAGKTRIALSALYSCTRPNDSLWHHQLGAHFSLRHKNMLLGVSLAEHLYSDSVSYYRNAKYNAHYFRGQQQLVAGANMRYHWSVVDLFAEVAATQNKEWGWGVIAGTRIRPAEGIGLLALYRYYSPWFDNPQGYAFSETSRLNDENGGYLALEVTRWRHWRLAAYADVFGFSGIKYGIPYAPSWGYDAAADIAWQRGKNGVEWRVRAREKAKLTTLSTRGRYTWTSGGWLLRTQLDANMVRDSLAQLSYGISLYENIEYTWPCALPLTLQMRVQAFAAPKWNNRIYCYENDVYSAFSIPATYGRGGRVYLNMRWRVLPRFTLYVRASETLYDDLRHRTDIHFQIRAML